MLKENLIKKYLKMNEYEQQFYDKNLKNILGIDEVGRGPLAGSLVFAGVILNPNQQILGLDDSKKINETKRKELNEEVVNKSSIYYIAEIKAERLDKIGLSKAIEEAINEIIINVNKQIPIDAVLIDYVKVKKEYPFPILSITKGDQKSNSIAAASIVAKVYRDEQMKKIAKKYPEYNFDKNVGYGTREHLDALNKYGPIKKIHRFSFKPIKNMEKK